MKTKLTLSLSENTVREAKQIAKMRKTTVSALFASSVGQWKSRLTGSSLGSTDTHPELDRLLGIFRSQKPFDSRSAKIREKHG